MGRREGKKLSKIVVGDADSLVALVYKHDANHVSARKISQWFEGKGYEVIYPNTAILEAITALKRSLNLNEEANLICSEYLAGSFSVYYIDHQIQLKASERFSKTNSKKNTIFDALVIEIALKLKADFIFSFDKWYQKSGFNLVQIP